MTVHLGVSKRIQPPCTKRMADGAWEELRTMAALASNWNYLAHTALTDPGEVLDRFLKDNDITRLDDPLISLRELAGALYRSMEYTPGSTDVDTPVQRVVARQRGVCQDYVHLMLAIARGWGIPSRYVSGYMLVQGAYHEQSADNATHAWCEFLLPEIGWLGIDPTNDSLADHRHVRIAVGRDYRDAAPTRGTVAGGGQDRLEVAVSVRTANAKPHPAQPRREVSNLHNIAPTVDTRLSQSQQQQ